jgi:hypothetical protein
MRARLKVFSSRLDDDASIRNSTQRLIRSFGFEQALISAIQFALRRGR